METIEIFKSILAGTAGAISIGAIALLLYIVFCNVFFNTNGSADKIFAHKTTEDEKGRQAFILPVALGSSMLLINLLITGYIYNGTYPQATGTVYSLFIKDNLLVSPYGILMSFISIIFYTLGSLIFYKIGGSRYSTLYCLNTALVSMTMPYVFSIVAFLWAVGYWAIKKKWYWLTVIAALATLAINIPPTGFSISQVIMIANLIAIPFMAKIKKEKYTLLTVVLALLSGAYMAFSRFIWIIV